MKKTPKKILFFIISLVLVSCGSNSILNEFSKRKYLPRFSKRNITLKNQLKVNIQEPKLTFSELIANSNTEVVEPEILFPKNNIKTEVSNIYENNKGIDKQKNFISLIPYRDYNKSKSAYISCKSYSGERYVNEKTIKILTFSTLAVWLIAGVSFFIMHFVYPNAAYGGSAFIIGVSSLLIAFLLTSVLVIALILYWLKI